MLEKVVSIVDLEVIDQSLENLHHVVIIARYTELVFLIVVGNDVSIYELRVGGQKVMQNLFAFEDSSAELKDKTVFDLC